VVIVVVVRMLSGSSDNLDEIASAFERSDPSWTPYEIVKTFICAVFLLPFRLCVVICGAVLYYIIVRVAAIRLSQESLLKKPLHKYRRKLINSGRIIGRIVLFGLGFWKIKVKGTNSVYAADGKEKANLYIVNHTSWVDILALMCTTNNIPSFVAKKSIETVPLFGFDSRVWQCIYVDRLSHREGTGALLKERATDYGMPEVVVFPEGTTSNGKQLIRFHTGGFLSGLPVKPVVLRYPHKHFSPAWESISAVQHIFRLMTQFSNHLEVTFLPVYIPSPAEKSNPELYSRRVQKLMADALGVPTREYSYQEKVKYLRALRDGRVQ